ncbi:MAG: TonB-dependent receptor [Bacteroidia bacterium]|nr:TonB-dependent receptor [Bacteroidia bacterium]
MKKNKLIIILLLFIYASTYCKAQNIFNVIVLDKDEKEPLSGVNVSIIGVANRAITDKSGKAILTQIANGKQVIEFKYPGFITRVDTFFFPLISEKIITVYLEEENEDLEEIVVSSTRSSRLISDIPTRIETIAAEELEEKGADQPGNIKMILTESTGIQTQQTSATSANASIRIQGLDGKYTQLLKDGFPLYAGFAGGLSILQIPPLDLKRVEVIKGSASTLYGGGAIAGLINLITKDPAEKRELTFMTNVTSAKGLDLSGYYNQKFKKIGITFFVARNTQQAYDPNKDNLSDIPQYDRYTFNPRFFYYFSPTATLSLGFNSTVENRLGGDMQVIQNKTDSAHTYFEKNITNRYSTQLKFVKNFKNKSVITVKNSITHFSRNIAWRNYNFGGQQIAGYTELTYLLPKEKTEWVSGLNVWTDQFKETPNVSLVQRDYTQFTVGAFVQNHWNLTEMFIAETGLRLDYVNQVAPLQTNKNSFHLLPRLSLLYKLTGNFTIRLGGGMGYKAPTIFSESAEATGFVNIKPINIQRSNSETSIGGNFDINYRILLFEDISFTINEMLFYTRLNNPLILNYIPVINANEFANANGNLTTQGSETNLKFKYEHIGIYVGYTFIDAQRHYDRVSIINPLTAKHRVNFMLMYEVENKIRIGFEAFYISSQVLNNGLHTRDYWMMGISAEKKFKHFTLFINAENFLDTRQSKYQPMYVGSIQNPQFSEIWAPTDGFVFNGGFKIIL